MEVKCGVFPDDQLVLLESNAGRDTYYISLLLKVIIRPPRTFDSYFNIENINGIMVRIDKIIAVISCVLHTHH